MDIIKNPIVLGILAAVVTYGFLYWKEQQKQKDNPDLETKQVNIMIPGVVGAIVWFIMGSFSSDSQTGGNSTTLPVNSIIHKYNENVELKSNKSEDMLNDTIDSKSFKLVKKGNIQLPGQDVFLDLGEW